ncbi:DUF5331 domain-containing protein [Fortiea contorta]|uniref:DUF5331 domain-containing protein n=1 Tax=Fortiea contorta TaxID=1892405 RepID=UPI00034C3FD3|nr:DUF5331 domain-containing protein [Fortiea contorta]
MNIQQLRQSLKIKWLNYYQQNRVWLVKLRIWRNYGGLRRPSSGFILATLSVLEPQFDEILAFILDLSNNPDQIVAALGLNFNPDEELKLVSPEFVQITQPVVDNSPAEKNFEDEFVPSMAVNDYQPGQGFARQTKVLSSVKVAAKVNSDRPLVTSVSVPSTANRASPTKMMLADQPNSRTRSQKPVRSPFEDPPRGTSLAIHNQVTHTTKTVPSLPTNHKNLSSLSIAIKIPHDGKPIKMQLQNCFDKTIQLPPTNARSLASWVDEFCQGVE